MKTRTTLGVSAVFWIGLALYYEKLELAVIVGILHAVMWHFHRLEVKVSRLLDDRGIRVTDKEIAE